MLDRERILAKIDELDSYLNDIEEILPETYREYHKTSMRPWTKVHGLFKISSQCKIVANYCLATNFVGSVLSFQSTSSFA